MTDALPRRMFIANRGEVAVRIARACAELGLESVAALSEDEAQAPHLKKAARVQSLGAAGVRAWLDAARPNAVARRRKTNQRTARENVADLPDPCLCHRRRLPLVLFSDGGGGRPGDKDFINSGGLDTPALTVITRKGHGLGAQGMAAGGFKNTLFSVAWPTGEFGGMGLEGYVRLGFRDQLAAIEDPAAREAEYQRLVAAEYARGAALSAASLFEIDDVIDPAETRRWIATGLDETPPPVRRAGKKHAWVDIW